MSRYPMVGVRGAVAPSCRGGLPHARDSRSRVERMSTDLRSDPHGDADAPTLTRPVDPATARHLHHLLATEQRRGRLPSVAAGIVRDGALAWSAGIGTLDGKAGGEVADTDTQYRMGSITKTFVAVAVMQLRDAGRLDLLDRFEDHVPGSRLGGAPIAQLLSHGAGVQAETNGPWWERTPGGDWESLAGPVAGQRFRAGRRFHYTNVGFAALGQLVARARGEDWFDVVRHDLLE